MQPSQLWQRRLLTRMSFFISVRRLKKGKRVQLEGISIYTTAEVLRIAREAEAKPTTKRPRGRPRKVIIVEKDSEEEAEDLESLLDSSDEEPAKRTRYATRSRGGC
jgi:hypothetical protein